jgi:predicted transcriptional regulator of viral defense system
VAYETGITHTVIEGITVPVYDIEKSVCDAIKHRNKIGIDVSSEILKNYLSRKTRDIDKLMKYAKIMRVASTIKKYLEIQL